MAKWNNAILNQMCPPMVREIATDASGIANVRRVHLEPDGIYTNSFKMIALRKRFREHFYI